MRLFSMDFSLLFWLVHCRAILKCKFCLHVDNKYRLLHFPFAHFEHLSLEHLISLSVWNFNFNANQCRFFGKLLNFFLLLKLTKRDMSPPHPIHTVVNLIWFSYPFHDFFSARIDSDMRWMPMTGQRLWIDDVQTQFSPLWSLTFYSYSSKCIMYHKMNHIAWVAGFCDISKKLLQSDIKKKIVHNMRLSKYPTQFTQKIWM